MRSARSHYRCACGRTLGDKLYIFDTVSSNQNEAATAAISRLSTHKGSVPATTTQTRDASQNDLSLQAYRHKAYGNDDEVKATHDVTSAVTTVSTLEGSNDDVVTPIHPSKVNNAASSSNHDAKTTSLVKAPASSSLQPDGHSSERKDRDKDISLSLASSARQRRHLPEDRKPEEEEECGPADTDTPHAQTHHRADTVSNSAMTMTSSTNALTSQMRQLLDDKERLTQKLSVSMEHQASLEQENQRLLRHVDDMAATDGPAELQSDDTSCSTDTEKELEQYKRHYVFMARELQILREENFHLRQSGHFVVSGEHSSPTDKWNCDVIPRCCDALPSQTGNRKDNVSSLPYNDGVIPTQTGVGDEDQKGDNLHSLSDKDAQTEFRDFELMMSYRTALTLVQQHLSGLKEEHQALHVCYDSLKNYVCSFRSTMTQMMEDTNCKTQAALTSVTSQYEEVRQKYVRELKRRQQLHNLLVELKGNIRVFCRIRPCIKGDNPGNSEEDARMVASPDQVDESLVHVDNKGRLLEFDLDKVFGTDSSQQQIFEEVSPLVRSSLDGYNVCVFAYGQTGSGKTFTMEGPPHDPGINQRALRLLFESMNQDGWTHHITACVLEIYNETIRDLLNSDLSNKLEVKLKPEGGLHVPGVVSVPVTSLQEINKVFETGRRHRATATTSMNDVSSRSHCLLCVTVHGQHADTGVSTTGRLNLVDLAGSERVGRSHADGARLREAQNINRSLACLGDVIHALRCKQAHVPYRNSKLTYLLQDSLGGDSKTLMIVQVSPAESNVSETVCSLNFGQRVRSVETGPATRQLNKTGNASPSTTRRPANLSLLHPHHHQNNLSPHSPLSPSSSSVLASPTTLLLTPSSFSPLSPLSSPSSLPQSPQPSPLSSPTRQRKSVSASSSSSSPSTTTVPTKPPPSTSSSSSSSLQPSPTRQRRNMSAFSSTSSPSSSSPSSPTKQRRAAFATSTSSTASSPSSPQLLSASSSLSSPSSSPKVQRSPVHVSSSSSVDESVASTPSSSSSSSSPSSSQVPSSSSQKIRKSTSSTTSKLSSPSSSSSSTPPSSPSLNSRRPRLSSAPTPPSSSSPANHRRSITRHMSLRSATSPTKSSLARGFSHTEPPAPSSSTPGPNTGSEPHTPNRVTYTRTKHATTAGRSAQSNANTDSSSPAHNHARFPRTKQGTRTTDQSRQSSKSSGPTPSPAHSPASLVTSRTPYSHIQPSTSTASTPPFRV